MKHLLRHNWTGKYFADGTWTRDLAQAKTFINALSAITCAIQNNLNHVEMVVMLGSEPSAHDDIRIPLSAH